MGFFDSAQDLLNRGMAATERGTRSLSLKAQLADANRQRDRAYAALGENLYAATHDDAMQRVGREELYLAVEEANRLREDIERQIAEVEEQSAAARAAAEERSAASQVIEAGAAGEPTAEGYAQAGAAGAAQPRICSTCGTAAAPEHKFCAACGAPLEPAEPLVVEAEVIATEDVATGDASDAHSAGDAGKN